VEMTARKFEDEYEMGEELGRGSYATVFHCTQKISGIACAVKIVRKLHIQLLSRLSAEIDILKSVHHPNIIELFDLFETGDSVYIVMELVTGGELFQRIVTMGSYSEYYASQTVKKLLMAVDYLHSKDIVHRDLKPENLLLKSPDEFTEVKIADFGLSKSIGKGVTTSTLCGTPAYVAPEILKGQPYGKEVDIWSIGVIAYLLLSGHPPFSEPTLFESIINADFDYPPDQWGSISDEAIDFIDSILIENPLKRPKAGQALRHKWFSVQVSTAPLKAAQKSLLEYQEKIKQSKR